MSTFCHKRDNTALLKGMKYFQSIPYFLPFLSLPLICKINVEIFLNEQVKNWYFLQCMEDVWHFLSYLAGEGPTLGELLFQTCTIFSRTAKHTIASCCQEYWWHCFLLLNVQTFLQVNICHWKLFKIVLLNCFEKLFDINKFALSIYDVILTGDLCLVHSTDVWHRLFGCTGIISIVLGFPINRQNENSQNKILQSLCKWEHREILAERFWSLEFTIHYSC